MSADLLYAFLHVRLLVHGSFCIDKIKYTLDYLAAVSSILRYTEKKEKKKNFLCL